MHILQDKNCENIFDSTILTELNHLAYRIYAVTFISDVINDGIQMIKNDCFESSLTPSIPNETRTMQRETNDTPCKSNAARYIESTQEREAVSYLKEKRIREIIDFLIGNLLLHRPYDPFEYLTQLLDRCILSRNGLVDPPSPFSLRDIISWAKQAQNQVDLAAVLNFTMNKEQTIGGKDFIRDHRNDRCLRKFDD